MVMEHTESQLHLPNAAATFVLGILSLLSSCTGIGLILGIVGLALSSKADKLYILNPAAYTNGGIHKAGRITAIIGVVLGGISFFGGLIAVVFLGGELFFLLDLMDFLDF